MKTIEDLLKNLARPEVLEFGLVTNRLPSVNIGGKFEPVDDEAPSTERLMQMLVTMGGSRYVDALTDKPVQWTTRLDGVGVIAVAAILRKDVVQARFTVAKRETRTIQAVVAPPAAAAPAPALAPPPPPPPAAAPPPAPAPPVAAPANTRPSEKTPAASPVKHVSASLPVGVAAASAAVGPPSGPVRPSASVKASAVVPTSPQPSGPPPAPLGPPEKEWEDDDEPTLQTLSPPVTHPIAKPKPARRPGEAAPVSKPHVVRISSPKIGPIAATAPSAAPATPATPSAPAPAARSVEPAPPPPEPEIPAPASTQPLLGDLAPRAGGRAGDERAVQERVAARLAEQRAAAERQRAAAPEPAAPPKAGVERRIATPTSVDVVDVVPSKESSSKRAPPLEIDLDADKQPKPEVKGRPRVDAAAAFDSFLAMAVAARASDLLVVAGRPILLRVATDLLPRTQSVSAEHVERIAKEIVPARLRDALEADGACEFAAEHPTHGRFRVNVSKQRAGYTLNLRVVPREAPALASLGLPDAAQSVLRAQRGLVLVTSPASQGRSTTLASLVDHLNRETQRHIVTVEEPIEHVHPRKKALVSQREVGVHARTKARALMSALREDADVLVIGDVADTLSARIALEAAEGGRLVLAAMASPRAGRSLRRFLDLFPRAEQGWARRALAGSIRLALGQRLVPSADRTRVHAALEAIAWSPTLSSFILGGAGGSLAEMPSLLRLEDAIAELVRKQRITAEMAKLYADDGGEGKAR